MYFVIFPCVASCLLNACGMPDSAALQVDRNQHSLFNSSLHHFADHSSPRTVTHSDSNQSPPRMGKPHHFFTNLRSGLILDPEAPLYAIFTSPSSTNHSIRTVSNAPVAHLAIGSSSHPPTNLGCNGTLLHRLRNFYENATRPIALSNPTSTKYDFPAPLGATSAAASSATLVNTVPPA
jgi:hypothetical protein